MIVKRQTFQYLVFFLCWSYSFIYYKRIIKTIGNDPNKEAGGIKFNSKFLFQSKPRVLPEMLA